MNRKERGKRQELRPLKAPRGWGLVAMVILNRLSVLDPEDRCPLLAEVESVQVSPGNHHHHHHSRKPDSRELLLSRCVCFCLFVYLKGSPLADAETSSWGPKKT